MNITNDTLSLLISIITIFGVAFAIYKSYNNPQQKLEKKQAVSEKEIDSKATVLAQKEVENKASLLAQQVEWEKIANEKKFNEFNLRIDNAFTLAQNHIHSLDTKVDVLINTVNTMSNNINCELTRLTTILNERNKNK